MSSFPVPVEQPRNRMPGSPFRLPSVPGPIVASRDLPSIGTSFLDGARDLSQVGSAVSAG
jgi:hypothetical protein